MAWKRDRPKRPGAPLEHGSQGRIASMRSFQGVTDQQVSAEVAGFPKNTVACTGAFTAAATGRPADGH